MPGMKGEISQNYNYQPLPCNVPILQDNSEIKYLQFEEEYKQSLRQILCVDSNQIIKYCYSSF